MEESNNNTSNPRDKDVIIRRCSQSEDDFSSCRSGSVRPPNLSDIDSEAPLSQYPDSSFGATELFTDSADAASHL